MAFDEGLDKEFKRLAELAKASPREQIAQAASILTDNVVNSAVGIVKATQSDDQRLAFSANKYVLDRVIPKADGTGEDDPLQAFLREMAEAANGGKDNG